MYENKNNLIEMPKFPELKNDNIINAAFGKYVSRVPIWLHRQAGRYLPEFRKIRENHSFFEICENKELVSKVTLLPLNRFDLDAAIIFSDILVIPKAAGFKVKMIKGTGPVILNPLTINDLKSLLRNKINVKESLNYILESITLTRINLKGKVPLIGFAGGPWTLMCYMIEGGSSKNFYKAKSWLFKYPEEVHKLLDYLSNIILEFLILQVKAGAQMIEIFESWAGILSPEEFTNFLLPYLKSIVKRYKIAIKNTPIIIFARGANYALKEIEQTNCDVISIDWTIEPSIARKEVSSKVTFQGNLDPCVLFSTRNMIEKKVKRMIDKFGVKNYIVNLGHGMLPNHEPEAVKWMIDAVHSYEIK